MNHTRIVQVMPIYGYGWSVAGELPYDVPKPFRAMLEVETSAGWTGVVMQSEHEFDACRVKASPRYKETSEIINVEIRPVDPRQKAILGWGHVSECGSIEAFFGSIPNDGSPPLSIEETNVAIAEG